MKKIIALFLLSPIVFANENNEIPLEVYMAELDWKTGPSESLYVTYRCMGLTGLMWSMVSNSPDDGLKDSTYQAQQICNSGHMLRASNKQAKI